MGISVSGVAVALSKLGKIFVQALLILYFSNDDAEELDIRIGFQKPFDCVFHSACFFCVQIFDGLVQYFCCVENFRVIHCYTVREVLLIVLFRRLS